MDDQQRDRMLRLALATSIVLAVVACAVGYALWQHFDFTLTASAGVVGFLVGMVVGYYRWKLDSAREADQPTHEDL